MERGKYCLINDSICGHKGGQRECGDCSSAIKHLRNIYEEVEPLGATDFNTFNMGSILKTSFDVGEWNKITMFFYIKKGERYYPPQLTKRCRD
ncbi:hypothetical protein ACFL1Q_01320 [Patescibacteria group bacterium]